jgi:hypothetical protein
MAQWRHRTALKEHPMKARHLAEAAMLAAFAWASPGHAQMMGPGDGMGPGFFSNGLARSSYFGPVDMESVAGYWIDGLHAALALTPDQEPAWQAFADAVAQQAADMQAFRTRLAQSVPATAPERAALAERLMQQRLVSVSAVSAAISALYAHLTPAQQAILDGGYGAACRPGGLFGG